MEEPAQITFGEWLKLRRKQLDLTQVELSERAMCSVVMIRKLESDARRPSKQMAAILAEALEIPAEEQGAFIQNIRKTLFLPPDYYLSLRPFETPPSAEPDLEPENMGGPVYLPAYITPFIGRRAEREQIVQLLQEANCRL
ncbi:MAG: helix-turn-helix domain-containing protein, partial [Anaerolineales bacterium]